MRRIVGSVIGLAALLVTGAAPATPPCDVPEECIEETVHRDIGNSATLEIVGDECLWTRWVTDHRVRTCWYPSPPDCEPRSALSIQPLAEASETYTITLPAGRAQGGVSCPAAPEWQKWCLAGVSCRCQDVDGQERFP